MNTKEITMTEAELNERFYNRTISWMRAIGEGIVLMMVFIGWVALCCSF